MKESRRAAPFQPLTDAECGSPSGEGIKKLLNDPRQCFYSLRLILDILLWIVWTGSQCGSPPGREVNRTWGLPWHSAYYYFRKWKRNNFFDYLKDELLIQRRIQQERKITPSAVGIDSQSIKKTSFVRLDTGIEGNKRVNGRKRHIAVDALGYPIVLCMTAANVSDNEAGKALADRLYAKLQVWSAPHSTLNRLALIRADNGCKTSFVEYVTKTYDWLVDISRGRPVKNQNPFKAWFHKWDVGK
jgi:transposase